METSVLISLVSFLSAVSVGFFTYLSNRRNASVQHAANNLKGFSDLCEGLQEQVNTQLLTIDKLRERVERLTDKHSQEYQSWQKEKEELRTELAELKIQYNMERGSWALEREELRTELEKIRLQYQQDKIAWDRERNNLKTQILELQSSHNKIFKEQM